MSRLTDGGKGCEGGTCATLMKNCDPFELGTPVLAIDSVPCQSARTSLAQLMPRPLRLAAPVHGVPRTPAFAARPEGRKRVSADLQAETRRACTRTGPAVAKIFADGCGEGGESAYGCVGVFRDVLVLDVPCARAASGGPPLRLALEAAAAASADSEPSAQCRHMVQSAAAW